VESNYLSDRAASDLSLIVQGLDLARELVATGPLSGAVAGELEPGPSVDLTDHARGTVASYYHPVGTCGLGAVVDDQAQVRGLDGLLVADASIIPIIPRAGTHLTTLAVAERVAELLLARG
jgi:choline dehydrogenase